MPKHLIAFNGEWVPDHAEEAELRDRAAAARAVLEEMLAQDVLTFATQVHGWGESSREPAGPFASGRCGCLQVQPYCIVIIRRK